MTILDLEVPKPVTVMWKTVSEDCNLACDYCYYSRLGGQIGPKINRIQSEVLEKFIREYMQLARGVAAFVWQGGEPLLAGLDFFREVVQFQAAYAKRNTVISNSIQTNATLMTQEWAEFFARYRFLVGVSIDGPQDVHDAHRVNRHGKGSFNRVMRGFDILRREQVDFNVLTVIHPGNISRVDELFDFYREQQFQYIQFIPAMDFHAQDPQKTPRYLISPQEYGRFLCEAFDRWYNNGNPTMSIRFFDNLLRMVLDQEPELCILAKTCPTTLVLEQNGDAYPCDFYMNDKYKIGNVGTDALTDILIRHQQSNFLTLKPTLPEKCQRCEFKQLCHGGCPRNRNWGAQNDVLDVDYFCESYIMFYRHALKRMNILANKLSLFVRR